MITTDNEADILSNAEPTARSESRFKTDDLNLSGETPRRPPGSGETIEYRFLASLADRNGQTMIMLVLLVLTLSTLFESLWWTIPAAAAVMMLRPLVSGWLANGDLLNHRGVRTTLIRTLREELVIGLGFMAVCFLAGWFTSSIEVILFVSVNLFVQSTVTFLVRHLVVKDPEGRLSWSPNKLQSVVVVGTGAKALQLADTILDRSELATRLIGFVDFKRQGLWRYRDIPLIGHPDQLYSRLGNSQIDMLLISLELGQLPKAAELFDLAERMGSPIGLVNSAFEPRLARPTGDRIGRFGVVRYQTAPTKKGRMVFKAAIDRILAGLGLLALSPVLFLTALLIKLESRGPIFFKQTRSGLNGRPFEIYKFRTMCNDAEEQKDSLRELNEMSGPVFKIASDPRVTKVGRYLRKYSIDEIPQLINVVRGEMSLVGPRPPLPTEVAGMEPWQRRKLSMRPGVTCTWQVSGRNAIDFEDWMRLDLEYIDNWSLAGDLKLIARTIPTVIRGSGS